LPELEEAAMAFVAVSFFTSATAGGVMAIERIVSGGQTGVDRGALDAALEFNFPCGGWCPADRMAEDGAIPVIYPLTVLPNAGYPERTRQNALDSDGTVILAPGRLTGGTRLTQMFCSRLNRPCLLIDASSTSDLNAVAEVARFVGDRGIRILNVAGPRESGWPLAHAYARRVILGFLRR
jgi:hypothetical protein